MKVILPVVDMDESKNNIAASFHKADFVCVYDSETNNYDWFDAAEISSKPGNLSLELKRRGIYTVISKFMPLLAYNLFSESGLKIFRAMSDDVQENVNLFMDNKLMTFTGQSATELSNCNGSCNSCSSSCSN